MSVNPLSGALFPIRPGTTGPAGTAAQGAATGAGRSGAAARATTPAAPAARPAAPRGGLPAEAPAGVDPQLWSVLTTDERAQFSRLAQIGPLTYGRTTTALSAQQATPPAVRGARLDIRI
jgi:hypothetical protein